MTRPKMAAVTAASMQATPFGIGADELAALPMVPSDAGGPVFRAPWQAQVFAMTLTLHRRGLFTWPEWTATLARQIAAAQTAGDADLGDTYYDHWLAALEYLVTVKGASTAFELERYRVAWDRAAGRTPHGAPIELRADDFDH